MGIIRRRFFVTFWGTKGKGIWFGIYKRLRVFLSLLCIGFGSYLPWVVLFWTIWDGWRGIERCAAVLFGYIPIDVFLVERLDGDGGKDMWVVAYGWVGMVIYYNIPSTTNLNINKTMSLSLSLSLSRALVNVMNVMEMLKGVGSGRHEN